MDKLRTKESSGIPCAICSRTPVPPTIFSTSVLSTNWRMDELEERIVRWNGGDVRLWTILIPSEAQDRAGPS